MLPEEIHGPVSSSTELFSKVQPVCGKHYKHSLWQQGCPESFGLLHSKLLLFFSLPTMGDIPSAAQPVPRLLPTPWLMAPSLPEQPGSSAFQQLPSCQAPVSLWRAPDDFFGCTSLSKGDSVVFPQPLWSWCCPTLNVPSMQALQELLNSPACAKQGRGGLCYCICCWLFSRTKPTQCKQKCSFF